MVEFFPIPYCSSLIRCLMRFFYNDHFIFSSLSENDDASMHPTIDIATGYQSRYHGSDVPVHGNLKNLFNMVGIFN